MRRMIRTIACLAVCFGVLVVGLSGSTQLVAAAEQKSLRILSPNGGELFYAGQPCSIKWSTEGSIDRVRILLQDIKNKKTYHVTYGQALDNTIKNTGSYTYTILPDKFGNNFKMQIMSADGSIQDGSDNTFSITLKPGPADIEIFPFQLMVANNTGGIFDLTWYTIKPSEKFVYPTSFQHISSIIDYKDKVHQKHGKLSEYWHVSFLTKIEVRNIGGQKSDYFTVLVYFDKYNCNKRESRNPPLEEYPPLAPGESRELFLGSCTSPYFKRGSAEFHTLHVMAAPNEYGQASKGMWLNNDFGAYIHFPNYWFNGLDLVKNEIYLGSSTKMSTLKHKKMVELWVPDQVTMKHVGLGRYKMDFWMDYTVTNKHPVDKQFWLQSQKIGKGKEKDLLYFTSLPLGTKEMWIHAKETKKYHVPVSVEASLDKFYYVEFRIIEQDTLTDFGHVDHIDNPDFVLDGLIRFRKR